MSDKQSLVFALALVTACSNGNSYSYSSARTTGGGPRDLQGRVAQSESEIAAAAIGRDVFRFETFGNEGFWTDAVRLPAGMIAEKVTPIQALDLGVQVDADAIPDGMKRQLMAELKADPSGRTAPMMNDPAVTVALINANAVIGMPIKDSNHDGVLDATKGDKVGASCALCHTMTDASAFSVPNGGSVGHRLDGRANHSLAIGKIFATATNTRALYPMLQLALRANGGKSLGRAPTGLTETSSEADVDAYLSNPEYYPVGMFDDTFDGNGDPMHNSPLFRQDLAAPFGSEGLIVHLENFSNLVYTSLFDLTTLTTPGGRAFLHTLAGAAGDELADNYVKVLSATGVTGYPFVDARKMGKPGDEATPVGLRVNDAKLLAMNAYLQGLPAPAGVHTDIASEARGREVFRTSTCTSCHNLDQGKPVPSRIIDMKTIFPGDNPMVLAQRMPPLNPILNSPGTFDDKMAVVNASPRGEKRGIALPLLLDLARKPVFLHDNSVPSLDNLFDESRGATAPHPFYVQDGARRADLIAYLRGLDTRHGSMTKVTK